MDTANTIEEYLAEIRKQVCACCVERPPGGPPCEPLGKVCGVEMHLPELIEAIHDIKSPWIHDYLEQNRAAICETCAFYHNGTVCPCPMDELILLIVKAVDTVDERCAAPEKENEEVALTALPDVAEIVRLYDETTGSWSGCDWPTVFGTAHLNLNGVTATTARERADDSTEAAHQWREAALWLSRIERYAGRAERAAAAAVMGARTGAWEDAVCQAEMAWMMEFIAGRPLRCRPAHSWRRFCRAIKRAAEAHRASRRLLSEDEVRISDCQPVRRLE
jgi:hypothetical protein